MVDRVEFDGSPLELSFVDGVKVAASLNRHLRYPEQFVMGWDLKPGDRIPKHEEVERFLTNLLHALNHFRIRADSVVVDGYRVVVRFGEDGE